MPLPRRSSQGLHLNVLSVLRPEGHRHTEGPHPYFFGEIAELCDPRSLLQPRAVRKQLLGKRFWFIPI